MIATALREALHRDEPPEGVAREYLGNEETWRMIGGLINWFRPVRSFTDLVRALEYMIQAYEARGDELDDAIRQRDHLTRERATVRHFLMGNDDDISN